MFVILETPSGYLQEHCSDKFTLTLHLKQKICYPMGNPAGELRAMTTTALMHRIERKSRATDCCQGVTTYRNAVTRSQG